MRPRVIGLMVAFATLASVGLRASAGASTGTACSATFHVLPGVGSTFVSQIRVRNVTCAKAQFAIGRYEHSLRHTTPFTVAHKTFRCTRQTIGPRSNGLSLITCRRGAAQRVSWHSAYGI